jgi:hypothetical protein
VGGGNLCAPHKTPSPKSNIPRHHTQNISRAAGRDDINQFNGLLCSSNAYSYKKPNLTIFCFI